MTDNEKHESEDEIRIREIIKRYGYHIASFEESNYLPAFAYTIGLWKNFKHPEVFCIGRSREIIFALLDSAAHKISTGEKLLPEIQYHEFTKESPVEFIPIHKSSISDYMGYSIWFNDYKPFEALQLVWSDEKKQFPWDKQFNSAYLICQPILNKELDFKFYTHHSLAVTTTKDFLEGTKSINYVFHTADAGWQFLSDINTDPTDIRFISISSIVKMDPTLNALFDLDEGEYASKDPSGNWTRDFIE